MSEALFIEAYSILDDPSKIEEEQVDAVESAARSAFPDLRTDEIERIVLDILMAHNKGKDPIDAARSQKITVRPAAPAAPIVSAGAAGGAAAAALPARQATTAGFAVALKPFDQLRNILGWENTDEDIERALAHNDFDLVRTIRMLAGEQAELELTKAQTASRIMCRYCITGNCARGDSCMYSHDGKSRLCRFWLHQRCVAEDSCIFLHEIPEDCLEKAGVVVMEPAPMAAPAVAFNSLPKLGALPKLGSKPPAAAAAGTKKSGAAQVPPPPLQQHQQHQQKVLKQLRPIKEVLSAHRGLVTLSYPRLIPWKATAFGENEQYCELRTRAAFHGEQRNKLLEQSTNAWNANDPARAKQLSDKGREHEQKMIQCHREAADLLWNQQTLPSSETWLDLHGMDLSDAIAELENKLKTAAEKKHSPRALYIITGRGHFFAKKYADQLSQYVVAYLDTHGYKHKDFGVDTFYGRITAADPWSKLRD